MNLHNPFFIVKLRRSGGYFLSDLVESTETRISFGEYLMLINEKCPDGQYVTNEIIVNTFYEAHKKSTLKSPNDRIWGTQVNTEELPYVDRYLKLKNIQHGDVKWIWLKRKNKVRHALSHLKAGQRDLWHLHYDSPSEKFDRYNIPTKVTESRLASKVVRLLKKDILCESYMQMHDIKPYIVIYEDLIDPQSWDTKIQGILDFLELDYTLPLNVKSDQIRLGSDNDVSPQLYRNVMELAYTEWVKELG